MADQSFDLFTRREKRVYKVGELTRELKGLLEGKFPALHVEGEISNFRRNTASGHCYFTLKDDGAALRCALFRNQARLLRFNPADGQHVLAKGRLSVYEAGGEYNLVCDSLEPLGAGALALKFEELKRRLAAEGLFDDAQKRRLPFLPRRIGVVTSPTGAAIQDFLRVLHKRWPEMPVLIAPARVQGEGAAGEICRGIQRLSAIPDVDVIVVTRGGGSLEDLWAFNEEIVARAIRRSPVPVVSAVGHEVDFTISDFAADLRAPTPTGAAEMIVRVKSEVKESLRVQEGRLARAMQRQLEQRRARLLAMKKGLSDPRRIIGERRFALDRLLQRGERNVRERIVQGRRAIRDSERALERSHPRTRLQAMRDALTKFEQRALKVMRERIAQGRRQIRDSEAALARNHPRAELANLREILGRLEQRAVRAMHADVAREQKKLGTLAARLDALSPLKVLSRGYALAYDSEGHLVHRASALEAGERVRVRVAEGSFEATVTDVQADERRAFDGPPSGE